MTSLRNSVPILEGASNFSLWEIHLKVYLQGLSLWQFVSGDAVLPVGNDAAAIAAIAWWKAEDAKAKAHIFQSLNQDEVMQVADKEYSKDVYDHLKTIYSSASEYQKTSTLGQFYSFTMLPNELPTTAYIRLTTIARSLSTLSMKVSDKEFIAKMLSVMPLETFGAFRLAWDSVEEARQTKDFLYTRLQNFELMYKTEAVAAAANNTTVSFFAGRQGKRGKFRGRGGRGQGGNRGGGPRSGNKNGKRCYNCDSPEHLARDCDQPRQETNNNNEQNPQSGNGNGNKTAGHNGNGNRNFRGRGRGGGNWNHRGATTRSYHANSEPQEETAGGKAASDEGHYTSYSLFSVDFFAPNADIEGERGAVFDEADTDDDSDYDDAVEELGGGDTSGTIPLKPTLKTNGKELMDEKYEHENVIYQCSTPTSILMPPTTTLIHTIGYKAMALVAYHLSANNRRTEIELPFILDSGSSHHSSGDRQSFSQLEFLKDPIQVRATGNNNVIQATGMGILELEELRDGKWQQCKIHNVLYIPGSVNLFAVAPLVDKGHRLVLDKDKAYFEYGDVIGPYADRMQQLYTLRFRRKQIFSLLAAADKSRLLHNRFGHICMDNLRLTAENQAATGIDANDLKTNFICDYCREGKATRQPFKRKAEITKCEPGEYLHIDLTGKLPLTIENQQYTNRWSPWTMHLISCKLLL